MLVLKGVAHWQLGVQAVAVASTCAFSLEIAGVDEVGNDPLGGAFGDPDVVGDIAEARSRVARDTEEHVSVVGEKRPVRHN